MKTIHLILTTFLSLAPIATSVAQEDQTIANEAEFTLHNYSPEWVRSNSLLRTVSSLYGRRLHFEDRIVDNLTVLDDSLVIYEEPERLKRILSAIKQLDVTSDLEDESASAEKVVLTADDMTLLSYVPVNVQASEFGQLATEIYGRRVQVEDSWHENLRVISNRSIVIYEERALAKGLLENLKSLDSSQALQEGSNLVVLEYQPRHLSPGGLMEGLTPFRTSIQVIKGNTINHVMNISVVSERGVILVRDYAESAHEILATMKSLDQPAPQVMISCQVISGVDEVTKKAAPMDLQSQLKFILPHKAYQVEAVGLLRASASTGSSMELEMAGEDGTQFSMQLRVGSFDEDTGALGLESCRLMQASSQRGNRQLFSTATTVFSGEYAVLGVTGEKPLFLVMQVLPVKAPN